MQEKVLVCQLSPTNNYPNNNFNQIEKWVKEAKAKGVSLCVFPEDFLFGIIRGRDALLEAGLEYEKWVKRFSELATKFQIDIVPGSLPRRVRSSIYNATVYINKKGEVAGECSKSNLWLSERGEYMSSKEEPEVFDTILGKTSLLICWDLMKHSLFESIVRKGGEWIICPTLWSTNQSPSLKEERGQATGLSRYHSFGDSKRLNNLIASRVFDYNIGIILCNIGEKAEYIDSKGKKIIARSAGRSQVVGPNYSVLSKPLPNKIQAISITIDAKITKEASSDAEILYGRREDILNTSTTQ